MNNIIIEKCNVTHKLKKPTKEEAMKAVETLILWAGDNPHREGLLDTPKRVVDAYLEMFSGYSQDPQAILAKTFPDTDKYNEIVLLKNIAFESCCEHHILPITGEAHIAYVAKDRLVGLSKLARLVDVFAKRLQTQEGMTAQILNALEASLSPLGVAVIIKAKHSCMSSRGVYKPDSITVTEKFSGCFNDNLMRDRFYKLINY